jgi:hypothetical protein
VIVVEISPFLNCTGPALFKWDKDGETLRNGPFSFRLNSFERPSLEEIVETNWELRWEQKVPNYWEFYGKAKPDESSTNGIFFPPFFFIYIFFVYMAVYFLLLILYIITVCLSHNFL